jgi:hypothetical protein
MNTVCAVDAAAIAAVSQRTIFAGPKQMIHLIETADGKPVLSQLDCQTRRVAQVTAPLTWAHASGVPTIAR